MNLYLIKQKIYYEIGEIRIIRRIRYFSFTYIFKLRQSSLVQEFDFKMSNTNENTVKV